MAIIRDMYKNVYGNSRYIKRDIYHDELLPYEFIIKFDNYTWQVDKDTNGEWYLVKRLKESDIILKLTQDIIRKLFDYDDGNLIRRSSVSNNTEIGDIAGYINSAGSGYLQIMIGGKSYSNHRIIWLWQYGYLPENFIDHIDRNTLNNRIENLREVSQSCNMRNAKQHHDNTSGVKGVIYNKKNNKWIGQISNKRKTCHSKSFDDFVEAVAHRLAYEQSLNWETCDSNSPAFQYIENWKKCRSESE